MRSFILLVVLLAAALAVTGKRVRWERYDWSDPAPSWETRPAKNKKLNLRDDDTKVIWRGTVDGSPKLTRDLAWSDAYSRASDAIQTVLGLEHPVPANAIDDVTVEHHEGSIETGTSVGATPKISLDLELKASQARELARRDRGYYVSDRVGMLSKLMAILVAGLFAVAGYVRLDEWSKGYYTRTIKVMALAAFAGATFFVWKMAH
jgi:hypothetical protein